MTILLAVTGVDAVVLAADTRTHTIATRQIKSTPSDKIAIWRDRAAWATGGYATAKDEIQPLLPRGGNLKDLNDAIIEGSKTVDERYLPQALAERIEPQNVFSLTVGFMGNKPTYFVNAPALDQYLVKDEPGFITGLGTHTETAQILADETARSSLHNNRLPADLWAVQTVMKKIERYPVEVGFPLDLVLFQRGNSRPLRRRIHGPRDFTPSQQWSIQIA
ncbi:hypothetical protein CN234_21580 [Sinorhizobium meliloti]|uniref:hypothetical protein n=1 Tax=Rhizobium meliloti TaxID=382 RepID=UPI000FD8630C|nr:hypothetical protein [Sinorhizobium meliloti]TWB03199.1 hypothetical protein FB000_10456 [Ensifer sp. SEMIA 134]TWB39483.1 hypothetical protein FB001_103271 [Ensifer sp. SEMIA 135]RVG06604.1 hypothetical protein CN234_21580 [Sinorhizobium meliloti]RVL13228.1 hypothetical protein CN147_31625 [Sinorhizobium meliloti]RVP96732.1 hypothetical protein CN069_25825 [Sinorhizobium meliloti]